MGIPCINHRPREVFNLINDPWQYRLGGLTSEASINKIILHINNY